MNFYQRSTYESLVANYPGRGEVELVRINNTANPYFKHMTRVNFDGVTPPATPGNYGNTLDCTWLAIKGNNSFGAKLMFSNTATDSSVLYGLGLRTRSYYAGAKAICFNAAASAGVDNSGQLIAGQFYMQTGGKTVAASLPCTALYCKSVLDAACANAASAIWIDDGSTVKATTQYMVDITMNGSIQLNDVFHIYGGDPGAAHFIDFDTCDQGSGAFLSADTTAFSAVSRTYKVKCLVNGTVTAYLSLSSN